VVASRAMQRPLAGMLVVDLTRYLPGAFATAELLRLGARVVRLEQPDGDPMRATAPGTGRPSVVSSFSSGSPRRPEVNIGHSVMP